MIQLVTTSPSSVDVGVHISRYEHNDALRLRGNLHPVSLKEIFDNDVSLSDLIDYLDAFDAAGRLSAGYKNGQIMFIAGSAPHDGNVRTTLFLFAKGHDRHMAMGLRAWARQEKAHYPDAVFSVYSTGDHPMKARFLAAAGAEHVEGSVFVVPATLKPALA